jgi:two-component system, OmpR family, sensor histidine kinase KdpD
MAEHSRDRQRADDERPDPEELLWRYGLQDERQESSLAAPSITGGATREGYVRKRGRRCVYLAAAAGSGKTYAMLNEGHRCCGGLCRDT